MAVRQTRVPMRTWGPLGPGPARTGSLPLQLRTRPYRVGAPRAGSHQHYMAAFDQANDFRIDIAGKAVHARTSCHAASRAIRPYSSAELRTLTGRPTPRSLLAEIAMAEPCTHLPAWSARKSQGRVCGPVRATVRTAANSSMPRLQARFRRSNWHLPIALSAR
jgi:hypothetical protein